MILADSEQSLTPWLRVLFVLFVGNPTSPQLVYNPKQYHVSDPEMLLKVATSPQELVWVWSQNTAHMTKSWFDIFDAWESTMGNAHNQAFHVNMYQSCGYWSFPGADGSRFPSCRFSVCISLRGCLCPFLTLRACGRGRKALPSF